MLVILLLGLLTFASLFLIFRVIYNLIKTDKLGDKFKVCISHSLCTNKEGFASKKKSKCKSGPDGVLCYNQISPVFQDVYMDIYQYYKENANTTKKKYLINMKLINTHLHIIGFGLVPLLFGSVIAKDFLLELIDYEVFNLPIMTFIMLLLYIIVSLYSFTLIFSFVKMSKINQETNYKTKNNILSLDTIPTTTATTTATTTKENFKSAPNSLPSNLYNKVYNEISMFGLISMILVIILSIFCSLALFLMDDTN